jgi:hypothetical protein
VGKAGSVLVTVPDRGQVCQGQARPPWGHVCIYSHGRSSDSESPAPDSGPGWARPSSESPSCPARSPSAPSQWHWQSRPGPARACGTRVFLKAASLPVPTLCAEGRPAFKFQGPKAAARPRAVSNSSAVVVSAEAPRVRVTFKVEVATACEQRLGRDADRHVSVPLTQWQTGTIPIIRVTTESHLSVSTTTVCRAPSRCPLSLSLTCQGRGSIVLPVLCRGGR